MKSLARLRRRRRSRARPGFRDGGEAVALPSTRSSWMPGLWVLPSCEGGGDGEDRIFDRSIGTGARGPPAPWTPVRRLARTLMSPILSPPASPARPRRRCPPPSPSSASRGGLWRGGVEKHLAHEESSEPGTTRARRTNEGTRRSSDRAGASSRPTARASCLVRATVMAVPVGGLHPPPQARRRTLPASASGVIARRHLLRRTVVSPRRGEGQARRISGILHTMRRGRPAEGLSGMGRGAIHQTRPGGDRRSGSRPPLRAATTVSAPNLSRNAGRGRGPSGGGRERCVAREGRRDRVARADAECEAARRVRR